MAMEIQNNYPDLLAGKSDYKSYGTKAAERKSSTGNAGKKETESMDDYADRLAKLVPSVDFKVGYGFSPAKDGKTLTVNPKLLEKMKNDPEKEKEMKELIRGVETMTKLMDSIYKGSGWSVVFKHSYIDENGQYRSIALIRNDFMLNMSDKLRKERRENEEKLLEKQKEKAKEAAKEAEEKVKEAEVKEAEEKEHKPGAEKESAFDEAKQLLLEKASESEDGNINLDHEEMQTILKAAKEIDRAKADKKEKQVIGGNLDLQV